MSKRKLVRWFVDWTDSWNHEFHEAIEAKIHGEYKKMFPDGAADPDETIKGMRSFYYARLTTTATLLLAVVAIAISTISVVLSILHS